jgi:hypothetical protein
VLAIPLVKYLGLKDKRTLPASMDPSALPRLSKVSDIDQRLALRNAGFLPKGRTEFIYKTDYSACTTLTGFLLSLLNVSEKVLETLLELPANA